MLLYLKLPQELLIQNLRIRVLYTILSGCCYTTILFLAVNNKVWTTSVDMGPYTTTSMWSPQLMNTSILRQSRSPLCQKLSAYDYQRDGTGHHKFTDFQCGTVCHLGQLEKNCVGASDVLQGDNQNVFIPTAMERTYINFNGDVETARHLISLEQDVQINLEYHVSMGAVTSSMNIVTTIEAFQHIQAAVLTRS